jgi:hypothetical protein
MSSGSFGCESQSCWSLPRPLGQRGQPSHMRAYCPDASTSVLPRSAMPSGESCLLALSDTRMSAFRNGDLPPDFTGRDPNRRPQTSWVLAASDASQVWREKECMWVALSGTNHGDQRRTTQGLDGRRDHASSVGSIALFTGLSWTVLALGRLRRGPADTIHHGSKESGGGPNMYCKCPEYRGQATSLNRFHGQAEMARSNESKGGTFLSEHHSWRSLAKPGSLCNLGRAFGEDSVGVIL